MELTQCESVFVCVFSRQVGTLFFFFYTHLKPLISSATERGDVCVCVCVFLCTFHTVSNQNFFFFLPNKTFSVSEDMFVDPLHFEGLFEV